MARSRYAVISAAAGLFVLVATAARGAARASNSSSPQPPTPPTPPTPSSRSPSPPPASSPGVVVPGARLMQRSRPGHIAVDLAAPDGTPVYAASDGVVRGIWRNGRLPGGGNTVALSHDPVEPETGTFYMHLESFAEGLHVGQVVRRYELLGYVGRTDSSADNGVFRESGPHLHFAVVSPLRTPREVTSFPSGRLDPIEWARAKGVRLSERIPS